MMDQESAAADQQMLAAISKGHTQLVMELIERGTFLEATYSPDGRTALHAAAECGHLEVLEALIGRGADLDARTNHGSTPLHLAVSCSQAAAVAALVAAGADVDAVNGVGRTPLSLAAQGIDVPIKKLLLDAGASVGAADNDGFTPLHYACNHTNSFIFHSVDQAASLLLAHGASVASTTKAGYTPLHCACERRHLAAVRVLLGAGAFVGAVTNSGKTPLLLAQSRWPDPSVAVEEVLISSGARLDVRDARGWAPLHIACEDGLFTPRVACLLKADSNPSHVDAVTHDGETPLHVACRCGNGKAVTLLLKAGADVHARDANGHTPLLTAVVAKHTVQVKQLLGAGADPCAADAAGWTGLHLCAGWGYTTILQQLVASMSAEQLSSSVNRHVKGMTALHWAVDNLHTACVKALLAAGANANQLYGAEAVVTDGTSIAGTCALHRAVAMRHTAAVPLLATTSNLGYMWRGNTALHRALAAGSAGVVMAQALVAAGAPAGLATSAGTTAMSLAARSSVAGCRALLSAMVRSECERYKQLQQGPKQQQQNQSAEQAAPAAILAGLWDSVYGLLETTAAAGLPCSTEVLVRCFQAVLEVLGGSAAGDLLQQVLMKAASNTAGSTTATLLLSRVLYSGWSTQVEPLMQQRWRVTNKLQALLSKRLLQQPRQQPSRQCKARPTAAAAAGAGRDQQQASGGGLCVLDRRAALEAEAQAAAGAGQWGTFVGVLEQLTGLHESCASSVQSVVEQQLGPGQAQEGMAGLCEALLEAWAAAQQQVAGRMQREVADAVVGAVEAFGQLWVVPGGRRGRRRGPLT